MSATCQQMVRNGCGMPTSMSLFGDHVKSGAATGGDETNDESGPETSHPAGRGFVERAVPM